MRYTGLFKYLVLIGIIPLALAGCGGGGSSNSTAKATATGFPFGAEGFLVVEDEDGNGTPEATTEISFSYNSSMQVTGYTVTEDGYDSENLITDRLVYEYEIDPDITPQSESSMRRSVARASASYGSQLGGALLSETRSSYGVDDATGELDATPSSQRAIQYSYNSAGYQTHMDRLYRYDNDYDGTVDEINHDIYTTTFDSANRLTYTASESHYDTDGDGTDNQSRMNEYAYTYDNYSNLILFAYTNSTDNDGDGSYESSTSEAVNIVHTYTDGLLTLSVATPEDSNPWQVAYEYDDQDRLVGATESRDTYTGSGNPYDTYTEYTYSYDSADNLTGKTIISTYDNNGDNMVDYRNDVVETWAYDAAKRITNKTYEYRSYSDPASGLVLSSHSGNVRTYSYDANANLAGYTYTSLNDPDNDGSLDQINYSHEYSYGYNSEGYLINLGYTYTSASSDEERTQTLSYTDGILTGVEIVRDDNGSQSRQVTTLTYNSNGRVIGYSMATDQDNDGTTDSTSTVELSYNSDDSLTLSISDGTKESSIDVDFTGVGIPEGTTDMIVSSMTIETPMVEDFNAFFSLGDKSDSRTYSFRMKIPKTLTFMNYGYFLGGDKD